MPKDRLPVLRPESGEGEWEDKTGPMRQYPGAQEPRPDPSPVTEVYWCPLSEGEREQLMRMLERGIRNSFEHRDALEGALDGLYAAFKPSRESKLLSSALQAVRERKQHGGLR